MNTKKMANIFGKLLMTISIVFIIFKLANYKDDIINNINLKSIIIVIFSSFAYGGLVYCLPFIYLNLIKIITGKSVPYRTVAYIYCKSSLYKYIPGNVMQYVGRNQLAINEELSHLDVAMATIAEISITIISAFLVAFIFSFTYAIEWYKNIKISLSIVYIMLILLVIFVIALFLLRKIIAKRFKTYFKLLTTKNLKIYVLLNLFNMLVLILDALLFLLVLWSIGGKLNFSGNIAAIGLFSFSFLLGYITPGVPGGIGVREAVLSYFFSQLVGTATILSGAVFFRTVSILGDLTAYFISLLVTRKNCSKTDT